MKHTYTEEQISSMSKEEFEALTPGEQANIKGAALAFMVKKQQEGLNS